MTFPPPDASGVNGQTIFVRLLAVIVMVAISVFAVAGALHVALWVGGFDGIVPFRVLIGVAVAYTLVRVIDVGLFRRPNDK